MSRENIVFTARIMQKCRKVDGCWDACLQLSKFKQQFAPQQRSLFAGAFKAFCSERKMMLRDLNQIEKFQQKQKKNDLNIIRDLRGKTMKQIKNAALKCLQVIDKYFKGQGTIQSQITSLKLRADACKFLYDVQSGDDRKKNAQLAHDYYQSAYEKASIKLKSTHPIRLGLALAFSSFYDGVFRDTVTACTIAKKAFDQGNKQLNEKDKQFFQDASQLLNMLKQNLTFWTSQLEKNVQ